MKRIILTLLLCLLAVPCSAQEQLAWMNPAVAGSGGTVAACSSANPKATDASPITYTCTGYSVCQNCEAFDNTNCSTSDGGDNSETWSCQKGTDATINLADTTSTVIRGSKQIKITTGSSESVVTSPSFSLNELYYHFAFIPSAVNVTRVLSQINHGPGTGVCQIQLLNTAKLRVTAIGGSAATVVDTMTSGVKYHIWGYYKSGSGTDAICSINFSSSATKPADEGNQYAVSNDGTHTDSTPAVIITLNGTASVATSDIFDQILVKDSPIGNVCED